MFDKVKKNFGFGCMRLPMVNDNVDITEFMHMVDTFLENGFNYFDTAHMYVHEQSEKALKIALTSRYPREDYVLVNKLSNSYFETQEDIRPLFQQQLDACGVEYFDFYLMHAQNAAFFEKYKKCKAYETAFELKKEGKVKHVGLSFHDSADVLDRILTEYPEIEVVQIQFNYLDYDDPSVQSKAVYDVARKHHKPLIIMEPVKGGRLVNLPDDAKRVFDQHSNNSYASYALRFAASFDGVFMVLSGMSNMEQINDNISTMKEFVPFNQEEYKLVEHVRSLFKQKRFIPCTGCEYCVPGCPKHILIPELFSIVNAKKMHKDWDDVKHYQQVTLNSGKASECIKCGKCEHSCPQHLSIREMLDSIARTYDC